MFYCLCADVLLFCLNFAAFFLFFSLLFSSLPFPFVTPRQVSRVVYTPSSVSLLIRPHPYAARLLRIGGEQWTEEGATPTARLDTIRHEREVEVSMRLRLNDTASFALHST